MPKERIPAKPNTVPDRPLQDDRDIAEELDRQRKTDGAPADKAVKPQKRGLGPRG
jgi:hypothetical protein